MTADPSFLVRVREACAVLPSLSNEIETARRMPPMAVDALARSGVFKMLVPHDVGGGQVNGATFVHALEEVARLDGSAGWAAMIGATSGLAASFLDPATRRAIFEPPNAVCSGVFAPTGQAIATPEGYRVTGRWAFNSGCEHAPWRMTGTLVLRDGEPERLPSGAPNVRCVVLAAEQTRVIDTWTVSGLRGTGSHDLEVEDALVPVERTFSLLSEAPQHDAPLYRMPFFGMLAGGIAAVTLGIARAAADALVSLAREKQPLGARRTVAQRELVQVAVAQAEAKIRGGHAQLIDAVGAAHAAAERGAVPVQERALLRLAACHATTEAAAAIDLLYNAGGGTSIYATSPLQRHFRDVHVATQHAMVSPQMLATVGRILLGLETDVTTL